MTEINLDNVLPLLKAAVDAKGEGYSYRDEYEACSYGFTPVDEDGDLLDDEPLYPACVVGHLVHQQGGVEALTLANEFTDAFDLFGFEVDYDATEDSLRDCFSGNAPAERLAALPLADLTEGLAGFEVTPDAARVLRAAQIVQDDNQCYTWGQAYAKAVDVHALLTAKAAA